MDVLSVITCCMNNDEVHFNVLFFSLPTPKLQYTGFKFELWPLHVFLFTVFHPAEIMSINVLSLFS